METDAHISMLDISKRRTFRVQMLKRSQAKFRQSLSRGLKVKKRWQTLKQVLPKVECTKDCSKAFMTELFPFWNIMRRYSLRRDLLPDLVAGLTVGIIHIPQGMAYGFLASLPPVYGLYTSFFPVLMYFFFGSSRHISMGTFAVTSVMVGAVVDKGYASHLEQKALASNNMTYFVDIRNETGLNGTLGSMAAVSSSALADPVKLALAMSVTFLVGLFQLILGMFRLGFIGTFLSDPLIGGFTTAAAVHVFSSQITHLFGINVPTYYGSFKLIFFYRDLFLNITQINPVTITASVACIFILILVKEGINNNSKCRGDIIVPVPIELMLIISVTLISYYTELEKDFDVQVVGEIPIGLPAPSISHFKYTGEVIGDAAVMGFVAYAISYSMAKLLADKNSYRINGNQELVANGMCNLIGSFFSSFCGSASLSRSLVQESSGGKTQVVGIVSSVMVLSVILYFGPFFQTLPKCILACIVIVSLKGMILQFRDLKRLWVLCKRDFAVWLVSFIATIVLDVGLGLLVGVVFALYFVLRHTQKPHIGTLGNLPGTGAYKDVKTSRRVIQLDGIKIFRFESSLYFANAQHFQDKLYEKTGLNPKRLRKKKRRALHRALLERYKELEDVNADKDTTCREKTPVKPQVSIEVVVEPDDDDGVGEEPDLCIKLPQESKEMLARFSQAWKPPIHTLIIDFSVINYIDSVAIGVISKIFHDYKEVGIKVFLAACKPCVRDVLRKTEFYNTLDYNCLYFTVHEAVVISQELHAQALTPTEETTAFDGTEETSIGREPDVTNTPESCVWSFSETYPEGDAKQGDSLDDTSDESDMSETSFSVSRSAAYETPVQESAISAAILEGSLPMMQIPDILSMDKEEDNTETQKT